MFHMIGQRLFTGRVAVAQAGYHPHSLSYPVPSRCTILYCVVLDSNIPILYPYQCHHLISTLISHHHSAMEFRKRIFEMTQKYTDNKNCWSPLSPDGQNNPLSSLPQLKSLFAEELVKRKFLEAFVGKCESELCDNLRNNLIPR